MKHISPKTLVLLRQLSENGFVELQEEKVLSVDDAKKMTINEIEKIANPLPGADVARIVR